MRIRNLIPMLTCVAGLALTSARASTGPRPEVIEPDLRAALAAAAPDAPIAAIATLAGAVDLSQYRVTGRTAAAARAQLVRALQDQAIRSQKAALELLTARHASRVVPLWLGNSIAFSAPSATITALAALPEVSSLRLDALIAHEPTLTAAPTGLAEWNIDMIRAPALWSLGFTGSAIVVATMDTGADLAHPDLAPRYRGGSSSWFDPNGQHTEPFDASGHGTQALGLILGGSASGTAIGVAPDARWISVKLFDDAGYAALSRIHQGFQWLLDPDGNPATNDAPDIVSNSWGFPARLNQCYMEFAPDIAALDAAGIAVVFAAGNSGPTSPSSQSPGDNPGALAVGAVDATTNVASFSARGPSACDGSVFPELVAPGVSVRTADLSLGGVVPDPYAWVSGTSFAAPEVAGALAVLASAHPDATMAGLVAALEVGAVDLNETGPDNASGFGLLDLVAAHALLGAVAPVAASDDGYSTLEDAVLRVSPPGVLGNDSGTDLTAALVSFPGHGTVQLLPDGSFSYDPAANYGGSDTFSYQASDGVTTSRIATVTIGVTTVNDPPVAAPDAFTVAASQVLVTVAPGVLANDSDVEQDPLTAMLVSPPPHAAAFSLSADGAFSYTPAAGFTGTDSFSYTVSDGSTSSGATSVTITVTAPVNAPPVARDDAATTLRNTPVTIKVAANDTDPDGSLVLSSIVVVRAPSKGKTVVHLDGTVTYTPARGYRGNDTFTYTIRDNLGTVSNVARVTVNVGALSANGAQ